MSGITGSLPYYTAHPAVRAFRSLGCKAHLCNEERDPQEEWRQGWGSCSAGVSHEWQKLIQWHDGEILYFAVCYRWSCWEERINQLGFYLKAKCCIILTKLRSMFSLKYFAQDPGNTLM